MSASLPCLVSPSNETEIPRFLSTPYLPPISEHEEKCLRSSIAESVHWTQIHDRRSPDEVYEAFIPDKPTVKPHICVWEHLSKDDMLSLNVMMIEDKKEHIFYLLAMKFPTEGSGSSAEILIELLYEVLRFCRLNNMDNRKTSALVSIFYLTHHYFTASLWRSPEEVYNYMKESLLLHTVLRPPKSAEILEAEECRAVLVHFCMIYLRYLPLIRVLLLPNYQLQVRWQPQPLHEEEEVKNEVNQVKSEVEEVQEEKKKEKKKKDTGKKKGKKK